MDRLNHYSIPFASLATGNHHYEYEVSDQFFESFENSVIQKADVKILLDLLKAETLLTLSFQFKGSIHTTCDRCLEAFDLPVNTTKILLVKFGEPGVGETDDVIVISYGDHQLNIAPHIYDFLSLEVPIRVVHPDEKNGEPGCNPEFLARLKVENDNKDSDKGDPRWEALKKLSDRKN